MIFLFKSVKDGDSKIKISLFISVEEDITKIVEVKKIEEQEQNNLQN